MLWIWKTEIPPSDGAELKHTDSSRMLNFVKTYRGRGTAVEENTRSKSTIHPWQSGRIIQKSVDGFISPPWSRFIEFNKLYNLLIHNHLLQSWWQYSAFWRLPLSFPFISSSSVNLPCICISTRKGVCEHQAGKKRENWLVIATNDSLSCC